MGNTLKSGHEARLFSKSRYLKINTHKYLVEKTNIESIISHIGTQWISFFTDYNNLRRKYSIAIADLSVFLFVQARDDELIQSFHFSCKI